MLKKTVLTFAFLTILTTFYGFNAQFSTPVTDDMLLNDDAADFGNSLLSDGDYVISAYDNIIRNISEKEGHDWRLMSAIAYHESRFTPDITSRSGARGLMQIMPDTGTWIAHKLGLDAVYNEQMLYDPACSVRFGCWFLRFLTDRFEGELPHIIAAYNAGHGSVEKWLDDPAYSQNGILTAIPYPETERYVEKVQTALEAYRTLYPDLFTDGLIESPDEA